MADFIGGMLSQASGSPGDGTDMDGSRHRPTPGRKRKSGASGRRGDQAGGVGGGGDYRGAGSITAAGLTIPREQPQSVSQVRRAA